MKIPKKPLTVIVACILVCGLAVGLGYGFGAIPYLGTKCNIIWSQGQTFNKNTDVTKTFDIGQSKHLNQNGEHEFVILDLTDIQLDSISASEYDITFTMLDKLIRKTNPDLITLTGDQVSGAYTRGALKRICAFLDSYDIPWAPVLGNHDGEGNITRNSNGDIFLRYDNVVFYKNDPSLGVGNYIITIESNNQPVHALFMIDSHNNRVYPNGEKDYDYIYPSQIAWYEWAIEGLQQQNANVRSSCYFHIPLVQYEDGYALYEEELRNAGKEYREKICYAKHDSGGYDSGLFAKIKELGSTDLVVVGHDHVNNTAVVYEGITLAYGLKSGYGSYWNADRIGGTIITVQKDGSSDLSYQLYVDGDFINW